MEIRADVITTMGQLSNIVYNDNKEGIDYFKNGYVFTANNHTYKVLDHTPPSNQGFNALLLQDTTGVAGRVKIGSMKAA